MNELGTDNDSADTASDNNDWGTIPPRREESKPTTPTYLPPKQQVTSKAIRVEKSPLAASLLSLLVVGLGQMYLGQVAKGILMLIIALILGALTSGISFFIVGPISMVDAYCIGKKIKKHIPVRKLEFF